jgi:hypothetical protein
LEAAHTSAEEALLRRIADLESAPTDRQVNAVENRVASLEACYTDRDAEFNNRLAKLEALRVLNNRDGLDGRVSTLEKATAELSSWKLEADGILDDVRIAIRKLQKRDRVVFDETPHSPSPLLTPT